MAETVIGQARLAGLAISDLTFQERFQLGQRTLELVGDAPYGAGFPNARDRFVQNIDLGHCLETQSRRFVPQADPSRRRNPDVSFKVSSGETTERNEWPVNDSSRSRQAPQAFWLR